MKYIVIGLGNFGGSLALRLTELGHEVIGVDVNEERVEKLKSRLSTTITMNAVTMEALSVLPLLQVDVVVVAIGTDFAASTQAVAALRQSGVQRIVARGLTALHVGVLQTLGVERVVFPEKDAAEAVAQTMSLGGFLSSYRIDNSNYVMQFVVPSSLVGRTIEQTGVIQTYMLRIIAIKKVLQVKNMLGLSHSERVIASDTTAQTVIEKGDILVVYGLLKDYDRLAHDLRQ